MSNRFDTSRRCTKCGWKYPSFHVCLNLAPEVMLHVEPAVKKLKTGRYSEPISHETREALTDHNLRLWTADRDQNRDRNEKMVQRYKDGLSYRKVAVEFEVPVRLVQTVIHLASEAGLVTIRSRGGVDAMTRVYSEES